MAYYGTYQGDSGRDYKTPIVPFLLTPLETAPNVTPIEDLLPQSFIDDFTRSELSRDNTCVIPRGVTPRRIQLVLSEQATWQLVCPYRAGPDLIDFVAHFYDRSEIRLVNIVGEQLRGIRLLSVLQQI